MAHRNTGIKLIRSKGSALVENTGNRPATEALRRIMVQRLKGHMDAFYEHGTLPDLVLLCAAFDRIEHERQEWSPERAWLIDELLSICSQ